MTLLTVRDDHATIRRLLGDVRVRTLGAGLDHRVYAVEDDLVARFGAGAAAEAALLEAVAPRLPLPVPVPVAIDPQAGCLVLSRISGAPLLASPARGSFAPALLEFADAVHALAPDVAVPVDDTPPAAWLDEAREAWPAVHAAVPAHLHGWVETFLAASPPAPVAERCFIHGDLGAEHVFADGDRITGVIDWGDAAFGDPALDHGRLVRDFGVEAGERARFYAVCTALEDVAYGRDPYVANAVAALEGLAAGR